jgi:hypothetical protein
MLAQKFGRWLRAAVLPEDRRAITDALRELVLLRRKG